MGEKSLQLQKQVTEIMAELHKRNAPTRGSKKVPIGLAIGGIMLTIGPHLQEELLHLTENFSMPAFWHMVIHNCPEIGGLVMMFFGGTTMMQARGNKR